MRNTLQYILKKLLFMIPMVLVITFLIYGGLELTPGDAISNMIPPDQLANVDPSQLEALRQAYGLNDPFLLRYLRWLWELLHGNFGYSITSGVPIKDILLQLFPRPWSSPWPRWSSPPCWAVSWASSAPSKRGPLGTTRSPCSA